MKQTNRFAHLAATVIVAGCVALVGTAAASEETTGVSVPAEDPVSDTTVTATGTIGRAANVESKLSAKFADFLGGEEQAARVVEGLRTGEEFQLGDTEDVRDDTSSTSSGPVTAADGNSQPVADEAVTGSSINPPTGTMGYGNVRITLKLAEAQLERLGISQPTSEQLSAVLVGGDIDGVPLEGILNERAAGAGWGEIAQRYDFKVGQLMGKAPAAKTVATPVEQQATHETTVAPSPSNGYIPSGKTKSTSVAQGSGKHTQRNSTQRSRNNGYIPSGSSSPGTSAIRNFADVGSAKRSGAKKNGYIPNGGSHGSGAGIVSAHGAGGTTQAKVKSGQPKGHMKGYVPSGNAQGAGIVSAGNAASAAAVSAAGGHGQAKGHTKGRGKAK